MLGLFINSAKSADGEVIKNDLGCQYFYPIITNTQYSFKKDDTACLLGYNPYLILNENVKISAQFYDNSTGKYGDVKSKSSFVGIGISQEDMDKNGILHPYLIKLTGKKDGAVANAYRVSAPRWYAEPYYSTKNGKRTLKAFSNKTYSIGMSVKVFSSKVTVEWKNNNQTVQITATQFKGVESTKETGKQADLLNAEIAAYPDLKETDTLYGKTEVSWTCDSTYTGISGTIPDKTKILTKGDFEGFPIWAIIVIVVVLVLLILLLVFWIMVWCRCMLVLAICPGYACCRPLV